MSEKNLKIAFLTSADPNDRLSWSGTLYYMWKALEKNCGDVTLLGPAKPYFTLACGKIFNAASKLLTGKRYNYSHSKMLSESYAKIFNKRLGKNKYDLIIAPAGAAQIACLKTDIPLIYISDSTVAASKDYHKSLSNLSGFSYNESFDIEKKAIEKAALVSYPSEWAANSAVKHYGTDPHKIVVIPFGANLSGLPHQNEDLSRTLSEKCKLLFIGVRWNEKGGPIAFETMKELLKMNIDVELTVCGCTPSGKYSHPKMKVIPFLNKEKENDYKQLIALYLNSDFLILPTRFEAYGIVFCEASAFGLPSLATDTGGVSGAITKGKNGFLLPSDAKGKEYAEKIADCFIDKKKYKEISFSSRKLYQEKLNWDAWARSLMTAIK